MTSSAPTKPLTGTARIIDVAVGASDVALTLDYPQGRHEWVLQDVRPSTTEASRDAAAVGRPIALRIAVHGNEIACTLTGTSGRGPCTRTVSLASALALSTYPVTAVLLIECSQNR